MPGTIQRRVRSCRPNVFAPASLARDRRPLDLARVDPVASWRRLLARTRAAAHPTTPATALAAVVALRAQSSASPDPEPCRRPAPEPQLLVAAGAAAPHTLEEVDGKQDQNDENDDPDDGHGSVLSLTGASPDWRSVPIQQVSGRSGLQTGSLLGRGEVWGPAAGGERRPGTESERPRAARAFDECRLLGRAGPSAG